MCDSKRSRPVNRAIYVARRPVCSPSPTSRTGSAHAVLPADDIDDVVYPYRLATGDCLSLRSVGPTGRSAPGAVALISLAVVR